MHVIVITINGERREPPGSATVEVLIKAASFHFAAH